MSQTILNPPVFKEHFFNVFPYRFSYPPEYLPADDIHQLHYHNIYEIGICYEGSGVCEYLEGSVPFKSGDTTMFLPYQPHYTKSTKNDLSKWVFSYFDLDTVFCQEGFQPELWKLFGESSSGLCGIISQTEHPDVCEMIRTLIDTSRDVSCKQRLVKCQLMIGQLLVLTAEKVGDKKAIKEFRKKSRVYQLQPALSYIRNHYKENISIPELADMCGMCTSSFRQHFIREIGVSPKDYLMTVRMNLVQHYLATTRIPIVEIGTLCGIPDAGNLYRHFCGRFNTSLREYRRNVQ